MKNSAFKVFGGCGTIVIVLVVVSIGFFCSGGCAKKKVINAPVVVTNAEGVKETVMKDVTIYPYGWANKSEKVEGIEYKVSVGNIIWSVILSETIAVPIYFTGWKLWEPVGLEATKPVIVVPSKD